MQQWSRINTISSLMPPWRLPRTPGDPEAWRRNLRGGTWGQRPRGTAETPGVPPPALPPAEGRPGNTRHRQPRLQEGAGVRTGNNSDPRSSLKQSKGPVSSQDRRNSGRMGKGDGVSFPKALKKLSKSSGIARRLQTTKILLRREKSWRATRLQWATIYAGGKPQGMDGCKRRSPGTIGRDPGEHGTPTAGNLCTLTHGWVWNPGQGSGACGWLGPRSSRDREGRVPSAEGNRRGPAKTWADTDGWGSGQRRSRWELKARVQGGARSQEDQARCQQEGAQGRALRNPLLIRAPLPEVQRVLLNKNEQQKKDSGWISHKHITKKKRKKAMKAHRKTCSWNR